MKAEDWPWSLPPGWRHLVTDLVRDLEAIAAQEGLDELEITDIKEKWGRLSVSLAICTDALDAKVELAEQQAERTCATCGGPAAPVDRWNARLLAKFATCLTVCDILADARAAARPRER